jgi:hypothetical protein
MILKNIFLKFIILLYILYIFSPIINADNELKKTIFDNDLLLDTKNCDLKLFNNKIEYNSSMQINKIEYRALLIGINDYPGESADLPYSINEINSFKKTLIDGGNWEESNIKILKNSRANITNIFNAINWLSDEADDNDVSIFYYSGHGSKALNSEYLLVYGGSISDLVLDEKLDSIKGRVIVILDSCYSGGFVDDLKGFKRIIMAACGKNNLTYQYSEIKSGIFGYFVNLSLQKITKNAEFTFLFAYLGTVSYSKKLSEEYGEDYSIYPKFSDGTLGITKIINRHNITKSFIYDLIYKIQSTIINKNDINFWRMK